VTPLDLSMNETPFPPLPAIAKLVTEAAERLNRYPDHAAAALLGGLAGRLGVPVEQVLVGPGSAGLIQFVIQALGPERSEVVHAALSFEAYPLLIANAGARPVPVPMDGAAHDLKAMAGAVNDRTRCVLVCNPNNPTGAAIRRDELVAFLDRVPPDVTVVLDEAYREFVRDPQVPDGLDLVRAYPNVCVLRTFSKAYGLAAVRVGYAVGPPPLIGRARLVGAVFFPSAPGQIAATASLEPEVQAEVTARCSAVAAERDRLRAALTGAGLPVPPSEANFLFLAVGERAIRFAQDCRAAGILVRAYPGHGVRVTIASPSENERFLTLTRELGSDSGA